MSNILDIIISPREALAALREKSDWLLPMLVTLALSVIGYFLGRDASIHATIGTVNHMLTTNSLYANIGDATKAKMLHDAAHPALIGAIATLAFMVALGIVMNALFLLIGNAIGGGDATFKSLLSASALISVPIVGLIQLITGIIEHIRGADGFSTARDIITALPSLALLAPNAPGPLFYFLGVIGIAALWGLILNVTALRATADVKGPITWIIPTAILLLSAASQAIWGLIS